MIVVYHSIHVPTQPNQWLLIVGMALFTVIIPIGGYAFTASFAGSARAGAAGAVELPTMFVAGWLAFGEEITLLQVIAGGLNAKSRHR